MITLSAMKIVTSMVQTHTMLQLEGTPSHAHWQLHCYVHSTAQHSTAQHSTAQHSMQQTFNFNSDHIRAHSMSCQVQKAGK